MRRYVGYALAAVLMLACDQNEGAMGLKSGADGAMTEQSAAASAPPMAPEPAQDMAQEKVLLEAVPPALVTHQLLFERLCVEANRPPKQRIKVLEGNRGRMLKMNSCQRVEAHRS